MKRMQSRQILPVLYIFLNFSAVKNPGSSNQFQLCHAAKFNDAGYVLRGTFRLKTKKYLYNPLPYSNLQHPQLHVLSLMFHKR